MGWKCRTLLQFFLGILISTSCKFASQEGGNISASGQRVDFFGKGTVDSATIRIAGFQEQLDTKGFRNKDVVWKAQAEFVLDSHVLKGEIEFIGNSSRGFGACQLPKLKFKAADGGGSIRLHTHCSMAVEDTFGRVGTEESIRRQHLIYQISASAGFPSSKTRLIQLTYLSCDSTMNNCGLAKTAVSGELKSKYAFLRESTSDTFKRLNLSRLEDGEVAKLPVVETYKSLMPLEDRLNVRIFQTMIQNQDWARKRWGSEILAGNMEYYRITPGDPKIHPVPEDFDSAHLATGLPWSETPIPELLLSEFQSEQVTKADALATIAKWEALKPKFTAIIGTDGEVAAPALAVLSEFYDALAKAKAFYLSL